ncbi:DUF262 domain-containing protein [Streptomyces diastaticus]|uniref:DUF262 domain-containing protein n=1 Tax=Streptomyces diastaticus TaxID=1956 RepID=UPI00365C15E8
MPLQDEIENGRATVKAEDYSMSIGEIVNLYRDNELVIRPEFQRLFRWSIEKKSRLVESILLGIPLPSLFVMQRHDGVWEVIDGLQRISTILEFMGELRNEENGELKPPSKLEGTKYLPSLNGLTFASDEGADSLTPGQRIAFKRSKLDINILLPESDEKAKYELFDRLNSGGEEPSAQEVRNCQLIMRNRDMFYWLSGLKVNPSFTDCTLVSVRQAEEQYDMELVCRFFALLNSNDEELKEMRSVDSFLTEKTLDLAEIRNFNREDQERTFENVFSMLSDALGSESFRRYDAEAGKFTGGFSVSSFEAIAVGVANSVDEWLRVNEAVRSDTLRDRVIGLWSQQFFRSQAKAGVRGTTRIRAIMPAAQAYFRP